MNKTSVENQLETLETTATEKANEAKCIRIQSQVALEKAVDFLGIIKGLKKQIKEAFDPIIRKAHEAHKVAVAQQKKYLLPLEEGEKAVKSEISNYNAEMERLKREAEESIRIQQEEAEAARLEKEREKQAKAQEAILDGDNERAAEILESETPEFPPEELPVIPEAPKAEGVHIRKKWCFRIEDVSKISRFYLIPNYKLIQESVNKNKDKTDIPGIEVYTEDIVVAR